MTQRELFRAIKRDGRPDLNSTCSRPEFKTLDQIFDGEEMAEFAEWQMLREANEAHDRRMRHNPWFRLL